MLQGSNASTGAKNQMPQNVDAMAAFGRHGVCALPEEDALVLFAQIAGSIVLRLAALTLSKRSLKVAMLKRLQASAPRGMRRCGDDPLDSLVERPMLCSPHDCLLRSDSLVQGRKAWLLSWR